MNWRTSDCQYPTQDHRQAGFRCWERGIKQIISTFTMSFIDLSLWQKLHSSQGALQNIPLSNHSFVEKQVRWIDSQCHIMKCSVSWRGCDNGLGSTCWRGHPVARLRGTEFALSSWNRFYHAETMPMRPPCMLPQKAVTGSGVVPAYRFCVTWS